MLLDNQAAVSAMKAGRSTSCLKLTRDFHDLTQMIHAEVRGVPGHSNIGGNEEADAAARAGLLALPPRQTQPSHTTLAYQRRLMYQLRQSLVDEWWSTACPTRYRDLDLEMRRKKPSELALPRNLYHYLLAARSGHGDYAAYHRRFNHEDANLHCVCGQETSPTYFIRCRRNAYHMRKLRKGLTVAAFTQQLLGPRCHEKFIEYTRVTGCFGNLSANLTSAGCEGSSN